MAKITEKEITDVDGRVIKVRNIEADIIETEWPDGTKEVIRNLPDPPKAEEWPWPLPGGPAEWRLFNFPIDRMVQMMRQGKPSAITLLSENGEILLKLVGLAIGGQLSADAQGFLMGTEAPLDD